MVRRSVSATQSTAKPPASISTAVRQAPLTATESPIARPSSTRRAAIDQAGAAAPPGAPRGCCPPSSTRPVNTASDRTREGAQPPGDQDVVAHPLGLDARAAAARRRGPRPRRRRAPRGPRARRSASARGTRRSGRPRRRRPARPRARRRPPRRATGCRARPAPPGPGAEALGAVARHQRPRRRPPRAGPPPGRRRRSAAATTITGASPASRTSADVERQARAASRTPPARAGAPGPRRRGR